LEEDENYDAALNAAISGPVLVVAAAPDEDSCNFPPGWEVRNIDSIVDEDDVFYDTVAFAGHDQRFNQLGPNHAPIIDAELNMREADAIAKAPFHIATGAT
jgi:hypothetical protein